MLKGQIQEQAEAGIIKAHHQWLNMADNEGLLQSRRPSIPEPPVPRYTPEMRKSVKWEEKDQSIPAQTAPFM